MLYTMIVILLVLWLLGFSLSVGGNLIHALLLMAAVVFLYNFLTVEAGGSSVREPCQTEVGQ